MDNVTVTLPRSDWQVLQAGLWKLPMENAFHTLQRLQQALRSADEAQAIVQRAIDQQVATANGQGDAA